MSREDGPLIPLILMLGVAIFMVCYALVVSLAG